MPTFTRSSAYDCEVRYVEPLRQPVTFGLRRPVILLPATLAGRNAEIQRAVLSHELFHVKRRDWGWLLAEEIVCAVLWFNPAVWWLVSRLHLAREIVVDELAVLATGRRRAYVEALLAFADETSLAPVAAFGGRRQLFDRLVLLSKEAVMSSHRLVFSCAVMAVVLAAGSWRAMDAFPLAAGQPQAARPNTPGPLEQRARPITPENPIPRRVNYEAPAYPAEARVAGAHGAVTLMITLDELGRVEETRRLEMTMTSTTPGVSLHLTGTDSAASGRFLINGSVDQSNVVRGIVAAFTEAAIRAVQQWRYDPPAAGPIAFPVTIAFSGANEGTAVQGSDARTPGAMGRVYANPGPTLPGGADPGWTEGALRVGGNIKTPTKVRDVRPVYPPDAQAAHVSGVVIVEARIGADGGVENARILRSIPLLDQAALDAVMQWRFVPTLLNGNPVPVIMTVTVNFALSRPPAVQARPGMPATVDVQEIKPKVRGPELIKEVKPSYTPEAMRAGIQGNVEMEVTIGIDGKVADARVTRSLPMLDEKALEAVRQWEFVPPSVPVMVEIEMTFRLKDRQRE